MKHIALPLLMLLGGCLTPVGIVDPENLRIDIVYHVVAIHAAETFTLTGGAGEITVEGSWVTPMGGHTLTVAYSNDLEAGYTLTIFAQQTTFGIASLVHHRYTVTLSGLPPGYYGWTIAHQSVGCGWCAEDVETTPQVVLRQGVNVR